MLALDSMLHYHNVFDQLRNFVTMPSASAAHAREERSTPDPPVEAGVVPAPPAPAKAGSPARFKSEILKAWEQSYSQGRSAFGPLNGGPTENGGENQHMHAAHAGTPATITGLREPGGPHAADPVAKLNPQFAPMLKAFPTLGSTRSTLNGQSPVDTTSRSHTGTAVLVPSNGMPALHNRVRRNNRPRIHVTPEEGSLFDTILKNPRTRLFTRPVAWIEDHNRHLNITWRSVQTIISTPFSLAALSSHYDADNVHADVNMIFLPSTRNEAPVCDALPRLYPHSSLLSLRADPFAEMRLWFDSRVYRFTSRVECLWRWPHAHDADANTSFMTESTLDAWSDTGAEGRSAAEVPEPHCGKPMLAYIGREWLRGLRSRHSLRAASMGPGNARNDPVARLCLLQEKQVLPEDPARDPRFVSILLAMAQEHIYPACPVPARFPGTVPPRMEVAPEFRDVTVRLLVHDLEGDFLVYKGIVTADYLKRFHYPLRSFKQEDGCLPGMEIEVTRVAESPRTGLRERLGAALGEEVVGPLFRDLGSTVQSEALTPDTERWTPMPEDVSAAFEDGSGPDEAVGRDSDEVTTPKAEGVEGHRNGVGPQNTGAEGATPLAVIEVSNGTVHGKRQRNSETPCPNGTGDGSLRRAGKKRRLSEEASTPVVLSN